MFFLGNAIKITILLEFSVGGKWVEICSRNECKRLMSFKLGPILNQFNWERNAKKPDQTADAIIAQKTARFGVPSLSIEVNSS